MEQNNSFFNRLSRLFSTDVIIRNKGGNQLKVIDINKIQSTNNFNRKDVDRTSRIYSPKNTSIFGQQQSLQHNYNRPLLYSDYDLMDTHPIIASVLDIISDESTLKNDMGEILQIKSSNDDIQKVLYNLHYDILNIEFNLWSWVRQMCKYGDFFLKLNISSEYGVINAIPYNAYHIERIEGYDPENPFSVRFKYHPMGVTPATNTYSQAQIKKEDELFFENHEMIHFRLITDTNFLPYGRSYIEPVRKLYKQLTMMEDAMLIHRIVRAPDRRVFYVNVASIPVNEVENFMQRTISTMKRTPHINPQTGDYDLKYNLTNLLEDYYLPTRGQDTSTKIENLPGLNWVGVEDINYLRDQLFAGLKVPKAFLGYEKDLTGKSTLAAEDIRFSRTIDRIQRIILSELYKISIIHLYSQGFSKEDITNFELGLTTPSIIYDQERIALLKEKIDLAKQIQESKILPEDWIYDNVFHLSSDQIDDIRDLIVEDAKRSFRLKQITEEGNDPKITGKSYGTPHDLASLYGGVGDKYDKVPDGYDENNPVGRPKEYSSSTHRVDDNFGKDRLGVRGMKKDNDESDSIKPSYKGGSPLALESLNSKLITELYKEEKSDDIDYLNENLLE